MHATLAVFVWATFWAALPVKLVAISGFVYVLLQAIKSKFPVITGKWAFLLNVAFTFVGVVSVAKPGDLESPNFWASLLLALASAAGIHGTVRSAAAKDPEPAKDTGLVPISGIAGAGFTDNNSTRYMAEKQAYNRKMAEQQAYGDTINAAEKVMGDAGASKGTTGLVIACILAASLGLAGCVATGANATTPPNATAPALPAGAVDQADATAFKILRPAHDFAGSISTDIISGKLKVTPDQQLAMQSLNKALNVADHAEQAYHNAGGGSTAAMNTAVTAVLEAWTKASASILQVAAN